MRAAERGCAAAGGDAAACVVVRRKAAEGWKGALAREAEQASGKQGAGLERRGGGGGGDGMTATMTETEAKTGRMCMFVYKTLIMISG